MPPTRPLTTLPHLVSTLSTKPSPTHTILRTLTTSPTLSSEGATGATRPGGAAHSDAFTKREKAAEDMWVREREKNIMAVLRDKIARQEALLEEDRRVLARMEDQYGRVAEGRG